MRGCLIEIELCNGEKILIERCWSKIYSLFEITKRSFKFVKRFPFIEVTKRRCCSFKIRTKYESFDSILDPKYEVNCTLVQFAQLFGVEIRSFEEAIVKNDIRGCN